MFGPDSHLTKCRQEASLQRVLYQTWCWEHNSCAASPSDCAALRFHRRRGKVGHKSGVGISLNLALGEGLGSIMIPDH